MSEPSERFGALTPYEKHLNPPSRIASENGPSPHTPLGNPPSASTPFWRSVIPQPVHWGIASLMIIGMIYLDISIPGIAIFYFVPSFYLFATTRGKPALVLHLALALALVLTVPVAAPHRVSPQGLFNRALGVGMAICIGLMLYERRRAEQRLKIANDTLESKIAARSEELKETVRRLSQSEQQFKLFMRQLPGLAWIKDAQGRYAYANDATLSFFGRSQEQLYGKTDYELLPQEMAQEFVGADLRAMARGSDSTTVKCPTKEGEQEEFALVNRFPLPDPDAKNVLVGGIAIDITERAHFEKSLQMMRFGVDHSGDSMFWLDRKGRILNVNQAACAGRGYTKDEMLALTVFDLDPDYPPEVWNDHFEELKQRGTLTLETRHRHRDGRMFPIEVNASYIKVGDQELNFASVRDITDRKQAEVQRRQLDSQMQRTQKLESLSVLAGGVAHDFNNLLTAILGNASLSKDHLQGDSPAALMLSEIEEAAHRAAELTQQLLAYSGKGKFDVQVTRLDHLVRSMIALLSSVVSKKASVEIDLSPATFEGDATQMRQVVMNLMLNASDALNGNAGSIHVRTGTRSASPEDLRSAYLPDELPGGEYVYVEVQDTGCGMTEEQKARIFDPFYTTKFTGRGLGLAAVLGIVRSHRGAIHVHSSPGQGSHFEVLLPSCREKAEQEPSINSVPPTGRGQGTILVIDDEPMVRDFASRALESSGYQVESAKDGGDGLALFEQNPKRFAAVLLDLTMPAMDGQEVLRKIRDLAPSMPVLIMSGYGEQELAVAPDLRAPSAFLHKPFDPQTLNTRLSDLFATR